jgi:hypothetical protein
MDNAMDTVGIPTDAAKRLKAFFEHTAYFLVNHEETDEHHHHKEEQNE